MNTFFSILDDLKDFLEYDEFEIFILKTFLMAYFHVFGLAEPHKFR